MISDSSWLISACGARAGARWRGTLRSPPARRPAPPSPPPGPRRGADRRPGGAVPHLEGVGRRLGLGRHRGGVGGHQVGWRLSPGAWSGGSLARFGRAREGAREWRGHKVGGLFPIFPTFRTFRPPGRPPIRLHPWLWPLSWLWSLALARLGRWRFLTWSPGQPGRWLSSCATAVPRPPRRGRSLTRAGAGPHLRPWVLGSFSLSSSPLCRSSSPLCRCCWARGLRGCGPILRCAGPPAACTLGPLPPRN
jgi:hypothetical protein